VSSGDLSLTWQLFDSGWDDVLRLVSSAQISVSLKKIKPSQLSLIGSLISSFSSKSPDLGATEIKLFSNP